MTTLSEYIKGYTLFIAALVDGTALAFTINVLCIYRSHILLPIRAFRIPITERATMKPHVLSTLIILLIAMLIVPVSAAVMHFDSEDCNIHIQKNVTTDTDDFGFVRFDLSDIPEFGNCTVYTSTNEYTTKAVYYNVDEPQKQKYSEEYYKLDIQVSAFLENEDVSGKTGYSLDWSDNTGNFAALASLRELRRQTILMEKQNELLEEQNGLMRTQMGMKYNCEMLNPGGFRSYDCAPVQL